MELASSQVIVVTGASSGIGAACCSLLKARGARVIGMDKNEPGDSDIDEFIAYDQGQPDDIDRAVAGIASNVTGLMNVAGVAPSSRFSAADVLRVNFFGVRHFTEAIVPKLGDGSSIVNMTSGAGAGWASNLANIKAFLALQDVEDIRAFVDEYRITNEGLGNEAAYPFSKQLLSVWTMISAGRWRTNGIRVNAVAPAAVETPIMGDFLSSFGKEAANRITAFGSATPQTIAKASAFLLSEDAAWINGTVLPVDSGAIAAGTMAKAGFGVEHN